MNKTYELVEIAKINTGLNSDYAIANMIEVTKGMVSHWKQGRNEASGLPLLKLIKASGLTIDDAINLMTKKATDQANTTGGNSAGVYYVK